MSKVAELDIKLQKQAEALGFKDVEQAFDNGYEVISDGNFAYLVKSDSNN